MNDTTELHAVASSHGAPAIETEYTEPKAAITLPVSDTAGMSETQTMALAWIDANRAAAMSGNDTVLARQMKVHLDHVFRGGAVPDSIAALDSSRAAAVAADSRPLAESIDDMQYGKQLDSITEFDTPALVNRSVVQGCPREAATAGAELAVAAGLNKTVSNILMDRLTHHVSKGFGLGELNDAQSADLLNVSVGLFGSEERASNEANLARAYLKSVGGDALLARIDKEAGSMGFDFHAITQLATLARQKGITLKGAK